MKYDLQYGNGFLPLEISSKLDVEKIQPMTVVDLSDYNTITHFLENPDGTKALSSIAIGKQSITIVINGGNDFRIIANLLDAVLGSLRAQVSDPENITILYPNTLETSENQQETFERLGSLKENGAQLIPHNSERPENLCFVGETPSYSTPVFVDKMFSEADLKIGIGTIRADVFVSATGGRMSVIPWVAGRKSIERNSKISAIHPVRPFVIDTATCRDLEEASVLAGLDVIVNAVPDYTDNIAAFAVGDPYTVWKKSIPTVQNLTEAPIRNKADITVISAGGSAYDRTLYDATDSLYCACEATEQGGVILLIAECSEGAGPSGFVKGISECNSEQEVALLSKTEFEIGMEKARLFWRALATRKIILCSRLRESLVTEHLHCLKVRDLNEGLELAQSLIVSRPRITLIPKGSRTIPFLKN